MYSIQTAVSDGNLTLLPLSIEYDSRELIHVYFDGVEDARQWAWVGESDKAISFSPAVEDGVVVRVQRITPLDTVPNIFGAAEPPYVGHAEFDADTVDQNFRQTLRVAQESTDRTDEAINRANEAVGIAESAVDTADQALDAIGDAVDAANQAVGIANNALDVAEGIDAKAQEALDTANDAEDVALSIDAKAQTALDNSNAAVLAASSATSTANDAHDIASGIDAKAQTALDNSNAAVLAAAGATSTANDAKDIAEGVDTKAQTALDTANAAEQTAQDAEDAVAGVYQSASSDHWDSTEPEETFPGMTWADTSSGLFKRRNAADTAWVVEGELLTYKANRNGDITQNFKAAPAAAMGDAVTFEQVFGLGQTRQVVTGSRTRLTVYTNTTGKPIWACIQGVPSPANADRFVQINRQGKQAVIGRPRYDGLGTASAETVIFPGETYSYDFSEGSMTNFEIAEYR